LDGRGRPTAPGDPAIDVDPSHIKIDLAPIRRELFRELAQGDSLEQMTPEQRQRVGREVNQRLLGIVQGLQLSAAEVQKKAEAAKQQATVDAAESRTSAQAKVSASASPSPVPAPAAVPPPPAAGASPPSPPTLPVQPAGPRARTPERPEQPERPEPPEQRERPEPPEPRERPEPREPREPRERPEKPMTKKAALTGTQLNVRVERDGKVVQQVNAEINLPNLLATVFANTKRASGEIPFAISRDGQLYAPTDADRARLATLDVGHVDETPGTKRVGNWVVVTMPDESGAGLRFGIAALTSSGSSLLRRLLVSGS